MVKVIFEDNHLLVLSKPGNLSTQPSPTAPDSLEAQAKVWLKAKYKKPGNVYLHAVHRLDRPVTGIVVFAKTSKALSRLQAAIRGNLTKKIYHAWVEGSLTSGVLEDYLIHGDHIALQGKPKDKEAKHCRLSYKAIKKTENKTLLEIELETGRYHQIRAQLGYRGHPVIGDKKYGSRSALDTIALHHSLFSIPHPVTCEMMTFESPPTDYFADYFASLSTL